MISTLSIISITSQYIIVELFFSAILGRSVDIINDMLYKNETMFKTIFFSNTISCLSDSAAK